MCGVTVILGWRHKGLLPAAAPSSKTSSTAPDRWPAVQRRDQILLDQMPPRATLMTKAAFRHRAKGLAFKMPAVSRVSDKRQTRMSVWARKRLSSPVARKAFDAGKCSCGAAPARDGKAKLVQTLRRRKRRSRPAPESRRAFLRCAVAASSGANGALALCLVEEALIAVADQHMHQHELRHFDRKRSVHEPHQRHVLGIVGVDRNPSTPAPSEKPL